jgi:hypothetical protein
MNRQQLIALWLGVVALIAAWSYPPLVITTSPSDNATPKPLTDAERRRFISEALAMSVPEERIRRSLATLEGYIGTEPRILREWGCLFRVWKGEQKFKIHALILGTEIVILTLITGALIVSFRSPPETEVVSECQTRNSR